jgi:hypothetical protein
MMATRGKSKDEPGGAHKRNFNRGPTGRYHNKQNTRGKMSRSKSRG